MDPESGASAKSARLVRAYDNSIQVEEPLGFDHFFFQSRRLSSRKTAA
jgi:hypothetical protein